MTRAGKLTPEQLQFHRELARITITVAERHPDLRGPWVFDEAELQKQADVARAFLGIPPPKGR